jgi:hypothetical protein
VAADGQNSELERVKIAARFDLYKRLVWVLYILAVYVPLRAVEPIADTLSGQDTHVTVAIGINITISIVLGGAALVLLLKTRRQREEIERLRRRTDQLEAKMDALNPGGGEP